MKKTKFEYLPIDKYTYGPITIANSDGVIIPFKQFVFPAGEIGVEFEEDALEYTGTEIIYVHAIISTPLEITQLALLVNAAKHMYPDSKFVLQIPYIPFGRQDRHTTPTTSWSLKVMADLINSMEFDEVITFTPHSNVTELLINNITPLEFYEDPTGNCSISQFEHMISYVVGSEKPPVFIAPDAGAEKRVYEVAKHYDFEEVYVACKKRNAVTGEIYGYSVPTDIPEGRDLVVVDDICDGGRTFIELAKKLPKNRKSLKLYVTHGIFSKGKNVLLDAGYDDVRAGFDFIYQRNYAHLDQ